MTQHKTQAEEGTKPLIPPSAAQAYQRFYRTLLAEGRIDPKLQDLVRLASAGLNRCAT